MNKETEQVPMKEGSITEQLNLLGELIEELTNQIGFLEERFKDVLFPVMQEEKAVQKRTTKILRSYYCTQNTQQTNRRVYIQD